jgi:ABC-type lipoprotein release transport system permease subunit
MFETLVQDGRYALRQLRRTPAFMAVGQVGRMLVFGGVLGLLAALALGRAASSLLFVIGGHDASAVAAGAALLVMVALTAGWLPARRATTVHPMIALREE